MTNREELAEKLTLEELTSIRYVHFPQKKHFIGLFAIILQKHKHLGKHTVLQDCFHFLGVNDISIFLLINVLKKFINLFAIVYFD